jgi:hemerythrin-like domain-containing protein
MMLHEHVLGRDCVGRMLEASQMQPFDSRTFAEAARQYIPLLRQHIFKENNVLFRMAERVMSDADDADVTSIMASPTRCGVETRSLAKSSLPRKMSHITRSPSFGVH